MTAWRLARRELRGGLAGARAAILGLAIGVAAIAGVGSLARAIQDGLDRDAKAILGGDLEITQRHRPAPPDALSRFAEAGTLSSIVELRSMAHFEGKHALIELKAVDAAYPLFGATQLDPAMALGEALVPHDGMFGAAVDRSILLRLGAQVGDTIRVGEESFIVRAALVSEPDRSTASFTIAPRVMIAMDALAATALIQPGSLAEYRYRLAFADGRKAAAFAEALKRDFPNEGWRVRDPSQASPRLKEIVERLRLYLTLVGLAALLVGGVGIANAVRIYVARRMETIAIFKGLGATHGLVFRVYLLQIAALCTIGLALGAAFGATLPFIAAPALKEIFPVPLRFALYPAQLALAAGFGALVTLLFALWPLLGTRAVSPALLFRSGALPPDARPRPRDLAVLAVLALALAGCAALFLDDPRISLWFAGGAAMAFALFRLAGTAIARMARSLARNAEGRPTLRLALANLHRPGAATPSVAVSLGLGLTILVAVAAIQANLAREVEQDMPSRAPAFFFVDIQPNQAEDFDAAVAAVPGAGRPERVPHLRGRIVKVNGVPAEQAAVSPDSAWILRGDRGVTTATEPPKGSEIVEGTWWPANYAGPPLVSFDSSAAKGLGLRVGDTLTVNVLGVDIEARVANLRRIDWRSLGINFTIVLSTGALEGAPITYVATVAAAPGAEDALENAVVARFPNITAVRVRDVLETATAVLGQVVGALRTAAAVTMAVGALVLGAAVAAERERRRYDSVVLKVLGASRRDILRAYAIEYGALGLAIAVLAALAGSAVAYGVLTFLMRSAWTPVPMAVLAAALPGTLLVLAAGFWSSWRAHSRPAAALLRNE